MGHAHACSCKDPAACGCGVTTVTEDCHCGGACTACVAKATQGTGGCGSGACGARPTGKAVVYQGRVIRVPPGKWAAPKYSARAPKPTSGPVAAGPLHARARSLAAARLQRLGLPADAAVAYLATVTAPLLALAANDDVGRYAAAMDLATAAADTTTVAGLAVARMAVAEAVWREGGFGPIDSVSFEDALQRAGDRWREDVRPTGDFAPERCQDPPPAGGTEDPVAHDARVACEARNRTGREAADAQATRLATQTATIRGVSETTAALFSGVFTVIGQRMTLDSTAAGQAAVDAATRYSQQLAGITDLNDKIVAAANAANQARGLAVQATNRARTHDVAGAIRDLGASIGAAGVATGLLLTAAVRALPAGVRDRLQREVDAAAAASDIAQRAIETEGARTPGGTTERPTTEPAGMGTLPKVGLVLAALLGLGYGAQKAGVLPSYGR